MIIKPNDLVQMKYDVLAGQELTHDQCVDLFDTIDEIVRVLGEKIVWKIVEENNNKTE